MSPKSIKRVIFGVLGLLILWKVGATLLAGGGDTTTSVLHGGIGVTLCYLAISGAG